jgi:hypothetical protein
VTDIAGMLVSGDLEGEPTGSTPVAQAGPRINASPGMGYRRSPCGPGDLPRYREQAHAPPQAQPPLEPPPSRRAAANIDSCRRASSRPHLGHAGEVSLIGRSRSKRCSHPMHTNS